MEAALHFLLALRKFRALPIAAAASAAGALLSGYFAFVYGDSPSVVAYFRGLAAIYGIAALVFPVVQAILDSVVDEKRKAERVETIVVINAATRPIVEGLASVAALPQAERPMYAAGLREATLASALRMVGADDGRASYFRVSGVPGSRVLANPITRSGNRLDTPTTEFREGEDVNAEVWPLIDGGTVVHYPDLRKDRPASWPADYKPKYECFISVGVKAGDVGFGLLTINSLKRRRLTYEDAATMEVLASLLATAEALCAGTQGLNKIRRGTR